MTNWTKLTQNLEERGFSVRRFATKEEAADYLDKEIDGVSVGFGGSMTVQEMGLYPQLASHNDAVWHWDKAGLEQAAVTDVYITSVNGLAETGELINIDGTGNRVASTIFGQKQGRPRLRRRPVAGPEHRLPKKRPAPGHEYPLRRQGGQMLRLPEPPAYLPGTGGAVGEAQGHRDHGGHPH